MKLTIEKLGPLSAQDKIDLAKIWPNQRPTEWQTDEHDKMIFGARFNDRLLAAVKVRIDGERAELEDLCVREVTRRRGVGLYLLEDLQFQLPRIQHFSMPTRPDDPVLGAFMRACGFELTPGGWAKARA